MYYKQQEWLKEAANDSIIVKLRKKRTEKLLEIYHLKWVRDRICVDLAKAEAHLSRVRTLHKELDEELAWIDGRYSFVKTIIPKGERKRGRKKSLKEKIKGMSNDERIQLIAELEKMS